MWSFIHILADIVLHCSKRICVGIALTCTWFNLKICFMLQLNLLTLEYWKSEIASEPGFEWGRIAYIVYEDTLPNNHELSFKTFDGNVDRMNVVSHVLNPPINARYIRVIPESYYLYEALRLEFYGCKTSKILLGWLFTLKRLWDLYFRSSIERTDVYICCPNHGPQRTSPLSPDFNRQLK